MSRDVGELALKYDVDAVEEAFAGARQHGARDPFAYALKTLKQKYGDGSPRKSEPENLRCDDCRLAGGIKWMTVVGGRGLCRGCAQGHPAPTNQRDWEAEAEEGYPSHVHVLQVSSTYKPTAAELKAPSLALCHREVERLPVETLVWWAHQPSCYAYPKVRKMVEKKLAQAGVTMPSPEHERANLTPAAKRVEAYWASVEGA